LSIEHHLSAEHIHYAWDREEIPRARVDSGDIVILETRDSADGYYDRTSTHADVARKGPLIGHPLTGPIYVTGADAGDCLAIKVLAVVPRQGFGWTAIRPGSGLLPREEFPSPFIVVWEIESDGFARMRHRQNIAIPVAPFPGIIGTAPRELGRHSTIPPRYCGGNMDIKHLVEGSTVYIPVFAPGALLSIGDAHAAQGDGEVCITAIEMAAQVRVRVDIVRGRLIAEPQFRTPPALVSSRDRGCFATTSHGPDLFESSRQAVRYMIDHLVAERGLSREEAYIVCSVAVDLKICEIVDAPNWIVSAVLPESIFV
jgi:acetamidase/formamidase